MYIISLTERIVKEEYLFVIKIRENFILFFINIMSIIYYNVLQLLLYTINYIKKCLI